MKRFLVVPALLAAGCSGASHGSADSSPAPSAPAAKPATPPPKPTVKEHAIAPESSVIAFDAAPAGKAPPGWKVGGTNQLGPLATWQVVADPSAPSAPHALALTAANHESQDTFNVCWTDSIAFHDGTIEVSFKANAGEVDQGGGPIWRVRDAQSYYICRVNPLERNFRVYYVLDGQRKQLASALCDAEVGAWHTIRVEQSGKRITCSLDGVKLLEAEDEHLPGTGGVGVWTKADAVTSFDDLKVAPR